MIASERYVAKTAFSVTVACNFYGDLFSRSLLMYVSMYHVHVISDDNRVQCIFGKSDHYVDETLIDALHCLQCDNRLQLLRRYVSGGRS